MASRIHELPQTKGSFRVSGFVNGVGRQNFYSDKKTKTGRDFRMLSFGVEYDARKTVYISLNGMQTDKVYFSKSENGKRITTAVNWADRDKPRNDKSEMIGVKINLSTEDENRKTFVPFDACGYLAENLDNGTPIFVRGNIDYSSYIDNDGNTRRSIKYVPQLVLHDNSSIDFDEYASLEECAQDRRHAFTQRIVYTGIEQEKENDKATGRFILSGKVVTYNDIINVEYIVPDKALATWIKKTIKPYCAMDVFGTINVVHFIEEADSDNPSKQNPMAYITAPSKTEVCITGVDDKSFDNETYTEKNVSEAMQRVRASKNAEKNYNTKATAETEDDDWDS